MTKIYVYLGIFFFIILLSLGTGIAKIFVKETIEITVTDKERIVESSGKTTSSKYLVFSENEVFENTDEILVWKFNSSDLQGNLHIGNTYKVTVIGWRIEWLSWYRNIISISDQ